jgi:disulfide bond formation protein DsbB
VNALARLAASRGYWLALFGVGLSMEAAALYLQYVHQYGPCVLCIHVRILVSALMLTALLALPLHGFRSGRAFAQFVTVMLLAGLVERAWRLLGIEQGFIEGECSFDLGLPLWLPLDQWFPAVFQVQDACGYTPTLVFGISLAELLLPLSVLLLVVAVAVLLVTLFGSRTGVRG